MDAVRFKLSQRTSRFYENHDDDFDANLNENKNTKRKTETDMRIFSSYLVSINETREPETIPADELDRHLATYFSVIKKHDGNEYEPASLRGMLCSIERYLRAKNYPVSLTRDAEFTNTRNMLKERQKLLRDLVKTEKGSKSDTIAISTVNRLNQLYLAKEFGPHNPSALINALCFAFVVHLKIRKAIDHKQLLWGDIVLKMSANNDEYLCYEPLQGYEYCRLPLKGISGYRVLAQCPETSLWDPISIYKLYRHKRPSGMMTPDSPFYLGIAVPIHDTQQQPWFKPVAMGVNKLNDLVRMIRDITGTLVHGPSYSFGTYDAKDTDDIETNNNNNDFPKSDDNSVDTSMASSPPKDTQSPAVDDQCRKEVKRTENVTCDGFHEIGTKSSIKNAANDPVPMRLKDSLAEDAKDKITSVLDNLGAEEKNDVIKWLKTIVCSGEFDRSPQRQSDSRKRIRLSIELDNTELEDSGSVEKKVKIQIIPSSKKEENETEPYPKTGTHSLGHDAADAFMERSEKGNTGSTYYDQTDNLHKMRQYVFKRALSYPDDHKHAKLSRPQTNPEQNGIPSPPSHFQTHTEAMLERANGHHINTAQSSDSEGPEKVADPIHPVHGYNPYAAWALDPRFAMFMRNGFMQTYQDFVSMYSNTEAKDI